jgi:hypothetical protein
MERDPHIGVTLMNIAYIPLLASYLIVTLSIGAATGRRSSCRDRVDVHLRHGRVPGRFGLGRIVLPATAGADVSPKSRSKG